MMTLRLQIIIGACILLALIIVVSMVRNRKLELKYALIWLGAGVAILLFDCFPSLMTWLSKRMGIASPVNMLFLLGFIFSLIIIFVLTIVVSRLSVRVKELAQEIALYEKDGKCKSDVRKGKNDE